MIQQAEMPRTPRPEPLATIRAGEGKDTWPVRIERRHDAFMVYGRASGFVVYIFHTRVQPSNFLVCVPNWHRSGWVPGDCSGPDVYQYVGVDNAIDAETLAAAIRYLVANRLYQGGGEENV